MSQFTLIQTEDTDLNPAEKRETGKDKDDSIHLINEGAYGCIFHPGISCRGTKENRNYITKIQKKTNITDNEKKISDIIRDKIRGNDHYFAPIVKQCNVSIARKYVSEIKKCKIFSKDSESEIESSTYISNKVRYVGNQNIRDYLVSMAKTPHFWNTVVECHLRLLDAIELLLDTNIVHMDIKSGNVLIDDDKPILIDFGISFHQTKFDVKKVFYVLETYTPWCIDIVLCNYLVSVVAKDTSPVSAADIDQIIHIFKYGYDADKDASIKNGVFSTSLVSPEYKNQFEESTRGYLKQTYVDEGATWGQLYNDMVSRHYATWDNYSISLMFMDILEQVYTEIEMLNPYVEILKSTVYSPPPTRLDVSDTRKQLVKLLLQIQAEEGGS